MYDDIPIKTYRIVQTIGKTYDGGLKSGLLIEEYVVMLLLNKEDNDPTARGIRIDIINGLLLFSFISSHFPCFT